MPIFPKNEKARPFLLLLIPLFVFEFFKIKDSFEQLLLGTLVFVLTIILLYYFVVKKKSIPIPFEIKILLGFFCILGSAILWNMVYFYFINHSPFRQDIFREPVQSLHAPLYGPNQIPLYPYYLLTTGSLLVAGLYSICFLPKRNLNLSTVFISLLQLILITGFCFSDGTRRWELSSVHFSTYKEGLPFFNSLPDLLINYVSKMGQMGVHNDHYPPGNLIILFLENKFAVPGFALLINIGATLLTLPVIKILSVKLNFNPSQAIFSMLLFVISANVLIFTTVDFSSVAMLLFILGVYHFIQYWNKKSLLSFFYLTSVIGVYAFFSFTVFLLLFFIAIMSLFFIYFKHVSFLKMVLFYLLLAVSLLAAYYTINLLTGFNWFQCFKKSLSHNQAIMKTNGFDSLFKYLMRSSGNLLAFILSSGITGVVFLAGFIKRRNMTQNQSIEIKQVHIFKYPCQELVRSFQFSTLITLLTISFSSLFFLETERIWLCFIPPMALSAVVGRPAISSIQRNLIIVAGLLTAGVLELYWCQI